MAGYSLNTKKKIILQEMYLLRHTRVVNCVTASRVLHLLSIVGNFSIKTSLYITLKLV